MGSPTPNWTTGAPSGRADERTPHPRSLPQSELKNMISQWCEKRSETECAFELPEMRRLAFYSLQSERKMGGGVDKQKIVPVSLSNSNMRPESSFLPVTPMPYAYPP
jgi:hypothetical protein